VPSDDQINKVFLVEDKIKTELNWTFQGKFQSKNIIFQKVNKILYKKFLILAGQNTRVEIEGKKNTLHFIKSIAKIKSLCS